MRCLSILWVAAFPLVLVTQAAYGQALLVDRTLPADQDGAAPLGVPHGFLGDHFQVGARGEVWVIDSLAVWAVADPSAGFEPRLSDLYESVSLFGGIESQLPTRGQPDCSCHKLVALQRGTLQPSADAPTPPGYASPWMHRAWRVEFRDLKWSVPGGLPIQFGVLATGRPTAALGQRYTWFNHAAEDGGAHDLRLFDEDGNLLGRYAPKELQPNPSLGWFPTRRRRSREFAIWAQASFASADGIHRG